MACTATAASAPAVSAESSTAAGGAGLPTHNTDIGCLHHEIPAHAESICDPVALLSDTWPPPVNAPIS